MATIRKKFHEIEIPELKTKVKAYASNLESLNNKTIKLDLTRLLRGKSLEATIKIKIEKDKAIGSIIKLSLLNFYIRRAMRKSTSYVEDSFLTEAKDVIVKIKPFLITRKKVSRAVRKTLRETSKEFLINYLKSKKIEEVFYDITSNKLQKTLSLKLKKIYPLALCEIKQISIEKNKQEPKLEPKKQ